MTRVPLLSGPERARNENWRRELVRLFPEGEFVLVVGSGPGMRLGYPGWEGLLAELTQIAERLGNENGNPFSVTRQVVGSPLQYAGHIKRHIRECAGSLDQYHSYLQKTFAARGTDAFHRMLVKLPVRDILTTNYDPSLQLALAHHDVAAAHSRCIVFAEDSRALVSDFMESLAKVDAPYVIAHLHGRFDRAQSIVLADDEYLRAYGSRFSDQERARLTDLIARELVRSDVTRAADVFLQEIEGAPPPWSLRRKCLWSMLSMRRIVFVGFGLRDPYLEAMLQLVACDLWQFGDVRHFAIMPSPADSTTAKARADELLWKYGIAAVFYEHWEGDDHLGLDSIIAEISRACNLARDTGFPSHPSPDANAGTPRSAGSNWVKRATEKMLGQVKRP